MKLIKSLILSLAVLVGFSSASNARDVTLSMWTHNQLYVDYFNTYLEEVQAAFPDDNMGLSCFCDEADDKIYRTARGLLIIEFDLIDNTTTSFSAAGRISFALPLRSPAHQNWNWINGR